MPLKLKLAANERFVVNGVVITNGDYRATLTINNFAHVMREKDVLQETDADTPTRRLYFVVQAMLMQPSPPPGLMDTYRALFAELRRAYIKPDNLAVLDDVDRAVAAGDFYKGMIRLKPLIEYESDLLNVDRHEWRRERRRTPFVGSLPRQSSSGRPMQAAKVP
jgi:flagellar protein FlbT